MRSLYTNLPGLYTRQKQAGQWLACSAREQDISAIRCKDFANWMGLVSLGIYVIMNVTPKLYDLQHENGCERNAPSMLLNPATQPPLPQTAKPPMVRGNLQSRCTSEDWAAEWIFQPFKRQIALLISVQYTTKDDKLLNSTNFATCGATSLISKSCGATKFQIENLLLHKF